MKTKGMFLLFALALTLQSFAYAEEASVHEAGTKYNYKMDSRHYSVTANPLGMLLGRFGGEASFKLADHVALISGISGYYLGIFGDSTSVRTAGGSLSIGSKFFLSDEAFKSGWYITPYVSGGYGSFKGDKGVVSTGFGGFSVLGGYGWVFNSGFTLNLGLGVGMSMYKSGSVMIVTPVPDLECSLGYSW